MASERSTFDSLPSRCSIINEKHPSLLGRCILFCLMLAVFVFGVFLAFIVGHWAAKPEKNTSKQIANLSSAPITTSSSSIILPKNTSEAVLKLVKGVGPKINLLMDVYPPALNSIPSNAFHFSSNNAAARKQRKAPLSKLPRTLRPVHYNLQLDFTHVTSKEQIFGNVSILIESFGNSTTPSEIVFHAATNVHIDRLRLHQRGLFISFCNSFMKLIHNPLFYNLLKTSNSGRNVGIESFKRDQRARIVRLLLKQPLKHGWYALEMQFITNICSDNDGGVQCYRSIEIIDLKVFQSADQLSVSQRAPIISFTTKFEPSLARTFLPCWDEPNWKATFNISILHSTSITVLSNEAPMQVQKKQRRSFVRTKFQETPPISTFLLAFTFGPYSSLERNTEHNVPLKIWAFPENLIHARFAADFSPYMFDQLAKEFVIPYPLSKIDFVSAPSFPVGGMENWGLIVFQNEMFLLDSLYESSSNMTVDLLAEQYDIKKIITHELAHQWFGNLVTINDWSELWLSEGFASYYVNDFLKKQHPFLATNEYFLQLSHLLTKQTSNEKVPLIKHFKTEAEVENAFNPYHLYTKGAVIVKMIHDLVGENNFREGVRRFLKTNAYKSVGRSALWRAMPAFTDHGLESIKLENAIESWLLNNGMPEVIVSRNYKFGSTRLIQRPSDQNRYVIYLRNTRVKKEWIDKIYASSQTIGRRISFVDRSKKAHGLNLKIKSLSAGSEKKNKQIVMKKLRLERKLTVGLFIFVGSHHFIGRRIKSRSLQERNGKERIGQHKQLWSIPFTYELGSQKNPFEIWLHNETIVFTDEEQEGSRVFLANVNWKYPYRVNYDIENWKMLAATLHENHLSIPLYSRMQLILDSEFYLKQSGVPEIYLYILSYLTKETDIGLLLFGLDALYRFFDMFRGSSISNLLLIFFKRVTEWLDKVMDDTKTKPELAALWLLDGNRLIQFYKLRCAVNLSTCDLKEKVCLLKQWRKLGGLADGDHYSQMTAICHHLFTSGTREEYDLIENGLKQFSGKWTTTLQLATCVRNEQILQKAVTQIIATRNAAVYTAMLQNEFTLLYNEKFRAIFWNRIAEMPLTERKFLFAIENEQTTQVAHMLVHSVRSSNELEWLINTVPDWGQYMKPHIEYLRRKFQWINEVATPRIQHFLLKVEVIMSLLLQETTLRHRRPTVQEIVRDLDAFNKTVDEVKEEKRASGGFLASISFLIIGGLVISEVRNFLHGEERHDYKFSVDTAFNEHPELELDMIVATPCTNLMSHFSGSVSYGSNFMNEFKRDPTRFEFTEKEAVYWNELKKVQRHARQGATLFKSLDEMTFISGSVEEGLKTEAETKQRQEAHAIQLDRKKNLDRSSGGGTLILIGNGFNVFHVVASNSGKDEGTACRIHGRVRVNKVKGDSLVITTGKGVGIDGIFAHFGGLGKRNILKNQTLNICLFLAGNVSHRIERFNFGPRIHGLVTPLAGVEQISETGLDEFHYFLKVVPTKIYHSGLFGGFTLTYQYSVTFMKKTPKPGIHAHTAIIIYYEFAATVIQVRRIQSSLLQMLIRICSAIGGVFATSILINSICMHLSSFWMDASKPERKKQLIYSPQQPNVVINT
ncbi:unnamed protein product [Thelazia callipaeda]|uniref:Peptidase_M1 domain-containing protein n=1 Tax=Thelazia callipaeda TaxID=103827 RepID=A0A0N5D8U2_THECL|nr:unnamed protein product [Thelazia callipaeda]